MSTGLKLTGLVVAGVLCLPAGGRADTQMRRQTHRVHSKKKAVVPPPVAFLEEREAPFPRFRSMLFQRLLPMLVTRMDCSPLWRRTLRWEISCVAFS